MSASPPKADLRQRNLNVCFGSLADILRCGSDVRSTPNSGHPLTLLECPLNAKSVCDGARWEAMASPALQTAKFAQTGCGLRSRSALDPTHWLQAEFNAHWKREAVGSRALYSPSMWPDVRFGSKADICSAKGHVCFSSNRDMRGTGQKRTFTPQFVGRL